MRNGIRTGLTSLLFAFASSVYPEAISLPTPEVDAYITLLPLDVIQRGKDIIQVFNTLLLRPFAKTTSEIALHTTLNGFIPFVNNISAVNSGTILLVTYRLAQGGNIAQNLYVAVPVEQIKAIIYSDTTITNPRFATTIPIGEIPYYTVSPIQRALDIQYLVNLYNNTQPYETAVQKVTIQTTLDGSSYYAPFANGLIPDVQSVFVPGPKGASYGTLMIVTYQINNLNYYIVISPEQVISVNYCPKNCS